MHSINKLPYTEYNILSVHQITKLQKQWLELHASVDYNALLFKKYNVNNFIGPY